MGQGLEDGVVLQRAESPHQRMLVASVAAVAVRTGRSGEGPWEVPAASSVEEEPLEEEELPWLRTGWVVRTLAEEAAVADILRRKAGEEVPGRRTRTGLEEVGRSSLAWVAPRTGVGRLPYLPRRKEPTSEAAPPAHRPQTGQTDSTWWSGVSERLRGACVRNVRYAPRTLAPAPPRTERRRRRRRRRRRLRPEEGP